MELHPSGQWRKLLKWVGYLEEIIAHARRVHPDADKVAIRLLGVFYDAYMLGIASTGDPDNVYASATIPLLQQRIKLQGEAFLFEDQGKSICDLAGSFNKVLGTLDNKESIACFEQAREISTVHGFSSVRAGACFGLGRVARTQQRYEDAATLFRTAVAEASLVDDVCEVYFCLELVDMLCKINAIDEAEQLIQRIPPLIKRATGPTYTGLTPMYLTYHMHSARVHEARGKLGEAEREVHKLIALVHENKSSIHDFRPMLLTILEDANRNLRVLNQKTGNKRLVKLMADLAKTQRMPRSGVSNGGTWREIVQR
jgi:tetratricopeptide (TPR) repeat protein